MRASLIIAPGIASLVGFGGTLALVIAAAAAVRATPLQLSSWVAAICLAKAASSLVLSVRYRMPIVSAWSTAGAALIGTSQGFGMNAAVGAFLLAAGLVMLTATLKPLGTLVARIPASVASAMLAGILFQFAIALFRGAEAAPMLVLPLLVLFLVMRLVNPMGAVLAVLFAGIALTFALGLNAPLPATLRLSEMVLITPTLEPAALVGLGLPLYLVTMASQNLPGLAVLRADGYDPPARAIFAVTGFFSFVSAFFGAHTTNLAAISAAICTGPDAHPDPAKRWIAGIFYAGFWVLLALVGASSVSLFAAMPGALIATVAGCALMGSLASSLGQALAADSQRFAAMITFAVTASGITFFGIGAAFWGLLAGLAVIGLDGAARRLRAAA